MSVRAAAALLCASLAAASPALAGTAQSVPPRGAEQERPLPTALWQRFPLGDRTLAPFTPIEAKRATVSPTPAPAAAADEQNRVARSMGIVLAVVLALATLAATAVVAARRRGAPAKAPPVALAAEEWDNWAQDRARWTGGGQPSEADTGELEDRQVADVGAGVTAILQAADEAAEGIRAKARKEAAAIRREAKRAADAQLEELNHECERLRGEADSYLQEARAAGDSYSTQRRREVDEAAAHVLAQAEQDAQETREAAQAMAKQIESESARLHELEQRAQVVEARLQRALVALRTTSDQIEETLDSRHGEPESLVEALDLERRTRAS